MSTAKWQNIAGFKNFFNNEHFWHRFTYADSGKLLQVGGVVIGAKLDIVLTVIDMNDIGNVIVTNYEANTTLKAPLVQHTSLLCFDEKMTKKTVTKLLFLAAEQIAFLLECMSIQT